MHFFATCAKGTEGALRRELAALRLPAVRGDRGGVSFEGPLEAGMRACLHARTAMRVLLELARFEAPSADALYDGARGVAWEEWLTVKTTLAVEATVSSSAITHSGYAALKVKDAVVDTLRAKLGARPDVDPKDPDVRIVLHLARGVATVALDLAGEPLHRRGYRAVTTVAPLKETLAAAVLVLGAVDVALPFVDPLAGSGTLAIEHALRARRIAPGLGRAFAFQRWAGYRGGPQSAWDRMKSEARAEVLPRAPAPIVARDLHPKAVAAARRNAAAAGVAEDVVIEEGDARELVPRWEAGAIVANPPYGERLMSGTSAVSGTRPGARPPESGTRRPGRGRVSGTESPEARFRGRGSSTDPQPAHDAAAARVQEKKLAGFYRGLAEMIARHHGWTAVLLSGSPLLPRAIPLVPDIDHRLWNGPIETHLLRYEIP